MRKILVPLLIAALLVGALFAAVDAQATYQVFENIRARTLTTLGDVTVGDDLTVTGNAALNGGMTTGALSTFGAGLVANSYIASTDLLYLIPAAPITVANGGIITPTSAVVELTAAGAVGAELAPCGDGQITVLLNTANQTITITDTSTTRLAGNAALGQWDSLTVVGSGVSCNEVARSNN